MAKLPPYAVLLRDLPTRRSFEITGPTVADWVSGLPMRDALGAPVADPDAGHGAAELELYDEEDHVFLSGPFRGHVVVACSRCVEPVRLEIDEKLRVTFMPRSEMPADDEEETEEGRDGKTAGAEGAEVSAGDLDLFPYDGEHVDLEPLFREQFVLAIPYAPLCREDCKGLCPQCGIDRNSATCSCEPPIDPRLAGLKGLKIPSGTGT